VKSELLAAAHGSARPCPRPPCAAEARRSILGALGDKVLRPVGIKAQCGLRCDAPTPDSYRLLATHYSLRAHSGTGVAEIKHVITSPLLWMAVGVVVGCYGWLRRDEPYGVITMVVGGALLVGLLHRAAAPAAQDHVTSG
jgi:hypothetical protein